MAITKPAEMLAIELSRFLERGEPEVRRAEALKHFHQGIIWLFRVPIALPFVAMAPELISVMRGRSGSVAHLAESANDVLGTGGLLLFMMMLSITPLATITGRQWHRVLRRDYGRAMFAVAGLDLILAASASATRVPGGLMARLGGHAFLATGTVATLLVVPLMITSNRAAQRALGRHWRSLHRLVYLAWLMILIHLAFLFAFRSFFIDSLIISAPLACARIPAVGRWWTNARRDGTFRRTRLVLAVVLLGVFVTGFVAFGIEFAHVGVAAFVQRPAD
jgi:sulfoxide reductase heme-binding subunit YedZ